MVSNRDVMVVTSMQIIDITLTMAVLEVVLTGVAYVEDVSYAKGRDHLAVLRVLPLAQVDLSGEHFVAKLFRY